MLTSYVRAAMRRARYEIIPDDGSYYGESPVSRAYTRARRHWKPAVNNSRKCSKSGCYSVSPEAFRSR